jgi:hypothetical protein
MPEIVPQANLILSKIEDKLKKYNDPVINSLLESLRGRYADIKSDILTSSYFSLALKLIEIGVYMCDITNRVIDITGGVPLKEEAKEIIDLFVKFKIQISDYVERSIEERLRYS